LAILLLIALALPLGVPASGQNGAPELEWGEDAALSESTEVSDDPTVALMPGGGMVIAWRERLVGRYNVFFAVLDEDGALVGERHQLGENLSASMDPAVAVDSYGRLHFVWTAMEDQELWYARAGPDGSIDNGPIRLTDATGDSAEASIWMDSRDHLHIVWFDGRDRLTWLYYMQLDHSGRKAIEDTQLVEVRTEQENAIAMDSQGDLHIAWNALAPATQIQWNAELHYSKLSTKGEVLVRDRLVATSRGTLGFPDMAIDLGDNVHLVWPEGFGPRERVMYARLDSSGRTLDGPNEVSSGGLEAAREVSIAVDGNDRLHLVWSQGPTGNSELMYNTLEPDGTPEGDPEQLTDAVGDSREPAIGLSPRGEPRVAWSDRRSGNAEVYLKVATLPSTGVDLAVYSNEITFDPPTALAGEEFEMTVVVHNHGDARSPQASVSILLDGSPMGPGTVLPISPGGSVDIGVDVTLGEGEHTFTIILDPMDQVRETNEVNNVASRSVRVYEPGKLIADAGPDQAVTAGKVLYLDATGTVYLGGGVLSYEWDLGDGSGPAYGLYIEHVYASAGTFTVAVRVSDGTIEDTDTCLVTVRERDDPPRAVIDPPGPVTADRLGPLVLSAELSTDDHGVRNATWDMGDGTILDGMSVSHSYAMHGVYVVKLTVFDTSDQFDINRTTVEVVNLLPEITSIEGPKKAKVGKVVAFSVTTQDPDGSISTVGWDFDARDGIVFDVEGSEASHVFKRKGTYNVTCIVRDNDGGQSVAHLELKVEENGSSSGIPGMDMVSALSGMISLAVLVTLFQRRGFDTNPYQSRDKKDR
jgi:hypothetical protein